MKEIRKLKKNPVKPRLVLGEGRKRKPPRLFLRMPPKSRSEALLAELRREAQARLKEQQGGGSGGVAMTTKQSTTTTDAASSGAAAASRPAAAKRPRWDDIEDEEEIVQPPPQQQRKAGRWDDDDEEEAAAPPPPPPPPPPLQPGRPPAPPPHPTASERAMAEAAAFKAMMKEAGGSGGGAEKEAIRGRSPSADVVDAPADDDDDGEEEEAEAKEEAEAAAATIPASAVVKEGYDDGEREEESLERALEEASVRGREQQAAAAASAAAGAAEPEAEEEGRRRQGEEVTAAASSAHAVAEQEEAERAARAAEATKATATTAAAAAAAAAAASVPPPPQPRPAPPPPRPPPPPLRQPCRSVDSFERLAKVSEGTYGVVYKARDRRTGEVVALKKIKMDPGPAGGAAAANGANASSNSAALWGFPLTSIREINVLLSLDHENIVRVSEVVVGGVGGGGASGGGSGNPNANLPNLNLLINSSVYLAMEWCDHDLCALQEAMRRPFTVAETKCVLQQLLAGVAHLHDCWFLHRDIKTANVLYSNRGGRVKLADFGLARAFGSPLRPYTKPVVTLYYRAPELLLGARLYSSPVDVWSLGCVMGELLLGKVMLSPDRSYLPRHEGIDGNGGGDDGSIGQMNAIASLLGPVDEEHWPGSSELPGLRSMRYPHRGKGLRSLFPAPGVGSGGSGGSGGGGNILADASQRLSGKGIDLLGSMLTLDPSRRITAAEAQRHPWFDEFPRATERALMPTFPESGRR